MSAESSDPLIGAVIADRYRIVERVGVGGMGTVYSARHLKLHRDFAIKVLRSTLRGDRRAVKRFMREAVTASAIAHEHVIDVLDTGFLPSGEAYFVMEYLRGEDLGATLLREGHMPWSRVRHIAMQLCGVLAVAHARGIVHRDLKPENCFRIHRGGDPDFIKILDFGVAKSSNLPGTGGLDGLTHSGEVLGTISYMAPEQATGLPVDHRVDVYATGVIMYQLLTGRLPYPGRNPLQVHTAILTTTAPPMRVAAPWANIPDELEQLVARAMHRDRGERLPDMESLATAILELTVEDGPRPHEPGDHAALADRALAVIVGQAVTAAASEAAGTPGQALTELVADPASRIAAPLDADGGLFATPSAVTERVIDPARRTTELVDADGGPSATRGPA